MFTITTIKTSKFTSNQQNILYFPLKALVSTYNEETLIDFGFILTKGKTFHEIITQETKTTFPSVTRKHHFLRP